MKDFVTKLSLYDILSMLIPGGMIFVYLSLYLGYQLRIDENVISSALGWTIALVISYLLGLVNHICTTYIWSEFRNTYLNLYSCYIVPVLKILMVYVFLGILGYIFQKMIFCMSDGIAILLFIPIAFFIIMIIGESCDYDEKCKDDYHKEYFSKYYYVMKCRYNDDITIMEGQVAFIQNMLFPITLFLLVPPQLICDKLYAGVCFFKCEYWYFALLMFVALIYTVFLRQKKIVERVLEDFEYLKQIVEGEKSS